MLWLSLCGSAVGRGRGGQDWCTLARFARQRTVLVEYVSRCSRRTICGTRQQHFPMWGGQGGVRVTGGEFIRPRCFHRGWGSAGQLTRRWSPRTDRDLAGQLVVLAESPRSRSPPLTFPRPKQTTVISFENFKGSISSVFRQTNHRQRTRAKAFTQLE